MIYFDEIIDRFIKTSNISVLRHHISDFHYVVPRILATCKNVTAMYEIVKEIGICRIVCLVEDYEECRTKLVLRIIMTNLIVYVDRCVEIVELFDYDCRTSDTLYMMMKMVGHFEGEMHHVTRKTKSKILSMFDDDVLVKYLANCEKHHYTTYYLDINEMIVDRLEGRFEEYKQHRIDIDNVGQHSVILCDDLLVYIAEMLNDDELFGVFANLGWWFNENAWIIFTRRFRSKRDYMDCHNAPYKFKYKGSKFMLRKVMTIKTGTIVPGVRQVACATGGKGNLVGFTDGISKRRGFAINLKLGYDVTKSKRYSTIKPLSRIGEMITVHWPDAIVEAEKYLNTHPERRLSVIQHACKFSNVEVAKTLMDFPRSILRFEDVWDNYHRVAAELIKNHCDGITRESLRHILSLKSYAKDSYELKAIAIKKFNNPIFLHKPNRLLVDYDLVMNDAFECLKRVAEKGMKELLEYHIKPKSLFIKQLIKLGMSNESQRKLVDNFGTIAKILSEPTYMILFKILSETSCKWTSWSKKNLTPEILRFCLLHKQRSVHLWGDDKVIALLTNSDSRIAEEAMKYMIKRQTIMNTPIPKKKKRFVRRTANRRYVVNRRYETRKAVSNMFINY